MNDERFWGGGAVVRDSILVGEGENLGLGIGQERPPYRHAVDKTYAPECMYPVSQSQCVIFYYTMQLRAFENRGKNTVKTKSSRSRIDIVSS